MPLDKRHITVSFIPTPYTFVDVPGFRKLWDAPERRTQGVYLWCIEFEGAFLVNYVGKAAAKGGFEQRLWTELCDWRAGRYWTPIDLEAFKTGQRKALSEHPANQRQRQLEELQPLMRILLAPVEKADCLKVESALVERLRQQSATLQFLSNLAIQRYRAPRDLEVSLTSPPLIIGLTAPIPRSLGAA